MMIWAFYEPPKGPPKGLLSARPSRVPSSIPPERSQSEGLGGLGASQRASQENPCMNDNIKNKNQVVLLTQMDLNEFRP